MTFAELLTKYIGYRPLAEISAACEAKGVKIDPSYLSRLRSGQRPAPDDRELVRLLAEVCDEDPEPLVLLADLERHPKETLSIALMMAYSLASGSLASASLLMKHMEALQTAVNKGELPTITMTYLPNLSREMSALSDLWSLFHNAQRTYAPLGYAATSDGKVTHQEALEAMAPAFSPRRELSEGDLIASLADLTGVPESAIKSAVWGLKQARSLLVADNFYRRPKYVAPRTDMEMFLSEFFAQRLGIGQVGLYDDVMKLQTFFGIDFKEQYQPFVTLASDYNIHIPKETKADWATIMNMAAGAKAADSSRPFPARPLDATAPEGGC